MAVSEFDLIKKYFTAETQRSDVIQGVGDDAALVKIPAQHSLAMTMDTMVANIHFDEHISAFDLGYKLIAVNFSDLAAMGAMPLWVLLAITLPEVNEAWLKDFSRGLFSLLDPFHCQLIGGDVTRGPLTLTVQANGLLPQQVALKRCGAAVGDLIYVSGSLGDAAIGLALLQKKLSITHAAADYFINKLHRPTPRIALGQALLGKATAAIDISDGLTSDLTHLLTASGVGAILQAAQLPISSQARALVDKQQAIDFVLHGGDDYELCFTIPPAARSYIESVNSELGITCYEIGEIVATPGINLIAEEKPAQLLLPGGYQHF